VRLGQVLTRNCINVVVNVNVNVPGASKTKELRVQLPYPGNYKSCPGCMTRLVPVMHEDEDEDEYRDIRSMKVVG
jgi:hypothetical protein